MVLDVHVGELVEVDEVVELTADLVVVDRDSTEDELGVADDLPGGDGLGDGGLLLGQLGVGPGERGVGNLSAPPDGGLALLGRLTLDDVQGPAGGLVGAPQSLLTGLGLDEHEVREHVDGHPALHGSGLESLEVGVLDGELDLSGPEVDLLGQLVGRLGRLLRLQGLGGLLAGADDRRGGRGRVGTRGGGRRPARPLLATRVDARHAVGVGVDLGLGVLVAHDVSSL